MARGLGDSPSLAAVRFVVFAALTFVAGYLGRLTFDDDLQIGLIVPASGVAVLWLATSDRRTRVGDLLGIAVTVGTALRLEGATWPQLLLAVILSLVTAVTWVALMRRLLPDLRGVGGKRPFGTLPDLAVFMAVSVATAAFTALLRGTGLFLLPSSDPATIGLTFIRNLTWIFAIVAFGLLALSHRWSEVQAWWTSIARRGLRLVETAVVLATTGAIASEVFSDAPTPYAFPLVLGTVWAAFRLPTLAATLLAVLLGSFAIYRTLNDTGPFVVGVGDLGSAAIAQAFLITNVLAALAITFGTDERRLTAERALVAEGRAADRARLLSAVISHLKEGVFVMGGDGSVGVRNPVARAVVGDGDRLLPPGDPAGSGRELLTLTGESLAFEDLPFVRAFAGVEVLDERYRLRDPHGPDRILSVSVIPVQREEEHADRLAVCAFRDVTREQGERDQLVAFAGVVAHDLKNPLTVVRGWLETLGDEVADDARVEAAQLRPMVSRAQSATEHMHGFIDDLLGFTVARDQRLETEQLDLSEVAEDVASLRRAGETGPGIDVQPGMIVFGDRMLVRQLLDNLVANAIKYVAAGERPEVSVTATELGDELEVSVSDNGIGIPPAMRERVFDSFARAHADRYAGQGLGLAICQRVVERHGGRIWVAEPVGSGTTVRFTLPLPDRAPGAPRTLDESATPS
ncbi:MAG: ATP-binding protein [Nocardioides sp.]